MYNFVAMVGSSAPIDLQFLLCLLLTFLLSLCFVEQGFRKVDPDRWEFANEGFLRGQKHLLKSINRRKPSHVHNQPQPPQGHSASTGACVEVGKFGLEEEIERLKRDKNVLMQELVRLRQQQQATDHQMQTMGQRLQGMEQRQQQMMSFLAKAMQSPGFLAQLVQQNDNNRRIEGGNKKRRFPKQEHGAEGECAAPDGQIVKYQPLMNEAAKAMLMQILKKMESTPRLDSTNSTDSFLIDNVSSAGAVNSGNSSSRISGVTLAEVPQTSGLYMSTASEFPITSAAIFEIQPSAAVLDVAATAQLPDGSVLSGVQKVVTPSQTEMVIPEFPSMQVTPESNVVDLPNMSFAVPEAGSVFLAPLLEADNFSADTDMDVLFDDPRLSSIHDWEQFLSENLLSGETEGEQFLSESLYSGETEEVELGTQESNATDTEGNPAKQNGWDKGQHMDNLTEQMGLLTSESKG